ncbi:MAG: hypothetical protein GC200_00495 [Tepidisphaera sp.]|nr:hypothetical protein [Tepidisphaera sp.]
MTKATLYAGLSERLAKAAAKAGTISTNCPKCGKHIASADINLSEGVAMCRACDTLSRLGDLIAAGDESQLREAAQGEAPEGVSVSDDGVQFTAVASTRSAGGALAAAGAALFWNGIVSVFVCVAIASTLNHVLGHVPAWFPMPGKPAGIPLGVLLFLWLFLTPFMLIGLALFIACLMSLAGRVEVRVREDEGRIFTGVGSLGYSQKFDASKVRRVSVERKQWTNSDGDARSSTYLLLQADRDVKFGSMIPEQRRRYLAGILLAALVPGKS